MKYSKDEIAKAKAELRLILKPGMTVYTKINHISRSGMSRSITPFLIIDNEPRYIAWSVCVLFGQSRDAYDGVKMDGCGMNMCFALVYNLGRYLYPEGFGTEGKGPHGYKNTPDTQAKAALLVSKGYTFRGRNGESSGWDTDGGYALNSRQL